MLRRLSNAEYTYTIRDLTGVESLDPAREFPVDGAAGEGFMNTGNALVMSPSLVTKYLDAGKDIASHAVLLPDGIRFSPKTTRRDWTEEILAEIREFYREFTDPSGGDKVNLQGIVFDTNDGGRLPLEKYLAARAAMERVVSKPGLGEPFPLTPALSPREREAPSGISSEIRRAAKEPKHAHRNEADAHSRTVSLSRGRGPGEGERRRKLRRVGLLRSQTQLSPEYLAALWNLLNANEPSFLLDSIRARWRAAKPADAAALAAEIAQWQKALWKFSSVGHIGKLGGPKAWMEPVNPLTAKQEVRFKIPASPDGKEVTLYLVHRMRATATSMISWSGNSRAWSRRAGRTLLLRDVREVSRELTQRRERIFATTAKSSGGRGGGRRRAGQERCRRTRAQTRRRSRRARRLARLSRHRFGRRGEDRGLFHQHDPRARRATISSRAGAASDTPQLVANSSDQHVRIPGNMKPHSVAVHPSPKLQAAVGWRSPVAGDVARRGEGARTRIPSAATA